jgi:amino acid adenylation domain-containing protein
MRAITCEVVGETALTRRCLALLAETGHHVAMVWSDAAETAAWAAARAIPVQSPKALDQAAARDPVDCIFAIGVGTAVPHALLARPGCPVLHVYAEAATAGPATILWHRWAPDPGEHLVLWAETQEPAATIGDCEAAALEGFADLMGLLSRGTPPRGTPLSGLGADRLVETNLFRPLRLAGGEAEPLDAEERRAILEDWSRSSETAVPFTTLHAMFEAAAARRPESAAVVFGGEVLTYQAVDARADAVAAALRRDRAALAPGAPVGLHVGRGPGIVIGMLAILKTGGAFVPLDPGYPAGRLRFMLADCGAGTVVSDDPARTARDLGIAPDRIVDVGRAAAGPPASQPMAPVGPEDVAYVIYTSGSTGRPKGALLTHAGACNMALAARDLLDIGPDSRVLQFASISFDASVWEIFQAVAAGAALHIASDAERRSGEALLHLLRRERITTATLMPSVLDQVPKEELPALRTLVVAGETCSIENARFWSQGRRLINAYGPTEASVCAAAWVYRPGDAPTRIGRPLPNVRLHVLDAAGEPVPAGVPGELHIGGIGVARGYVGRPELTAASFVANPFGDGRLYRSGDLVRWAEPGVLDYIGRIDNQAKIGGVRIEPDEIARAVEAHPGVRRSVVIVSEEEAGKALLAFYVPAAEPVPAPALVEALSRSLPSAMVPARFIPIDGFPLTGSGKTDRAALAALARPPRGSAPPRTETEQALADMWGDILGVRTVGRDDNFQALGGDSLRMTRLLHRINQRFGTALVASRFRGFATLADLAAHIDAARGEPVSAEVATVEDF